MTLPTFKATTNQPQGPAEMVVLGQVANQDVERQQEGQCEHGHKALRLRGGGKGKDCLLAVLGCWICCECCEGCCDCVGDILCFPCELIC